MIDSRLLAASIMILTQIGGCASRETDSEISFTQSFYDAGNLEVNELPFVYSVFIEGKNGLRPRVDRISASCGCAKAVPKGFDASGKFFEVELWLARHSPTKKTITITATNEHDKICMTRVRFGVIGSISADPSPPFFGVVRPGEEITAVLQLRSERNMVPLRVKVAIPPDENSEATPDIEKLDEHSYRIRMTASEKRGPARAFVRVVDEAERLLLPEIPVHWEVRPPVWLSPRELTVHKTINSRSLVFSVEDDSEEISTIDGTGAIKVESWKHETIANGVQRVTVEFFADLSRNRLQEEDKMIVTTTRGNQIEIAVRLSNRES